jgi:hypothetical protein
MEKADVSRGSDMAYLTSRGCITYSLLPVGGLGEELTNWLADRLLRTLRSAVSISAHPNDPPRQELLWRWIPVGGRDRIIRPSP